MVNSMHNRDVIKGLSEAYVICSHVAAGVDDWTSAGKARKQAMDRVLRDLDAVMKSYE